MLRGSLLILISTILVGGCAKLEQPSQKSLLTFPKGRMAVDAVGLELGVAQLDSTQEGTVGKFWRNLDQQELPLSMRKLLDANGIRVGVMSSHAPPEFNELVGDAEIDPDVLNEFESQLHAKGLLRPKRRMVTHQRISNREGQAYEVVTSTVHPEASWTIEVGDSQTTGFGQQVRGVISITTYPRGDGSVRLVVRPEVHHGQERPRIGVGESSFLIESSQFVAPVEELKFELNLRAGESLIIAPTPDRSALGQLLFGEVSSELEVAGAIDTEAKAPGLADEIDNGKVERPANLYRMMMVRVVQTQMDDLFSDANMGEKLTTQTVR